MRRADAPPPIPPAGVERCGCDALIDEVPVAMVYAGATLAVMMATPTDLVDFAVGFTLTEGVSAEAPDVDVVRHLAGVECRMALGAGDALALRARRRALAGSSSCGVCGVRSLAEAVRPPRDVGGAALRLDARDVRRAVEGLRARQPLHDATHAAHAAGFYVPGEGVILAREDVGRHNALDKLAGALAREAAPVERGLVVLTSRVSVEMVQKAAALGAPALVAVSAPTALAVRAARAAGITLVGNARRGNFDVFTHPHRIAPVPLGATPPGTIPDASPSAPPARRAPTAGRRPTERARP